VLLDPSPCPPPGLKLDLNLHKGPQELVGALDSSRRPFDGELAGITLWPETEKIFGHGYEVVSYTYPPWFLNVNQPYSQSHSVFHIHGIFWRLLAKQPAWSMQSFGFMTLARTRFSENLYKATF